MTLFAIVAIAFLAAPLAGWIGDRAAPLLAVIPGTVFVGFCLLLPGVAAGRW